MTGRETEPWEVCLFRTLRSQMPVIAKAIETAALMLGSDRSRGYCLEMICADFLAGANLDHGDPETLLFSMTRFFKFLPGEQQAGIPRRLEREGLMNSIVRNLSVLRLDPVAYEKLAAAGAASGRLALSIVWQDGELGRSITSSFAAIPAATPKRT